MLASPEARHTAKQGLPPLGIAPIALPPRPFHGSPDGPRKAQGHHKQAEQKDEVDFHCQQRRYWYTRSPASAARQAPPIPGPPTTAHPSKANSMGNICWLSHGSRLSTATWAARPTHVVAVACVRFGSAPADGTRNQSDRGQKRDGTEDAEHHEPVLHDRPCMLGGKARCHEEPQQNLRRGKRAAAQARQSTGEQAGKHDARRKQTEVRRHTRRHAGHAVRIRSCKDPCLSPSETASPQG